MNNETTKQDTKNLINVAAYAATADPQDPFSFLQTYDTYEMDKNLSVAVNLFNGKKIIKANALFPDGSALAPEIYFIIGEGLGNFGYGKNTNLSIIERIVEEDGEKFLVDAMGEKHHIYLDSESGQYMLNSMNYVHNATVKEMGLKTMRFVSADQSYHWIKGGGTYKGYNVVNGYLEIVADKNAKFYKINYGYNQRVDSITDWRFTQKNKLQFEYVNDLLDKITDTSTQKSTSFEFFKSGLNYGKIFQIKYSENYWIKFDFSEDGDFEIKTSDCRNLKFLRSGENGFTLKEQSAVENIKNNDAVNECSPTDKPGNRWYNWAKYAFENLGATVEKKDGVKELYTFDSAGYITQLITVTNGIVTDAVKCHFSKDTNGKIKAAYPTHASHSCLNRYNLSSFSFVDGAKTVVEYKNDLPQNKSVSRNFITNVTSGNTDLQSRTQFTYNAENLITQEVTENKYLVSNPYQLLRNETVTVLYSYDANNNLIKKTQYVAERLNAEGSSVTEYEYNYYGMLIKTTQYNTKNPENKFITTSSYDGYGRLANQTDENGVSKYFVYNGYTNQISNINQSGKFSRIFTYDDLGNVIRHSCGNQTNSVTYTAGKVTKMTDGKFALTNTYNFSRQPDVTCFNGKFHERSVTLDEEHSLTIDAMNNQYDCNFNFEDRYCILNRKLAAEGDNAQIYKAYFNGDGSVGQEIYGDYETEYQYNQLGQPIEFREKGKNDGYVYTEIFRYNSFGLVNTLVINGWDLKKAEYNFEYDSNDNVSNTYFNYGLNQDYCVKTMYYYDVYKRNIGKLVNYTDEETGEQVERKIIVYKQGTNLPEKVTYGDGSSISYEYDGCGNISKITYSDGTVYEYGYDGYNRLISENGKEISYDYYGNITQKNGLSYGYTAGNKLTSFNGRAIEYDANGNMTTGGLVWEGNRLVCDGVYRYNYDGKGRMIARIDGNYKMEYRYDSRDRLISMKDNLQTTVQFFYDEEGVAGLIVNGEPYFYRKDIQGNVIAVLDKTGAVVVKYEYDAWGEHSSYMFDDPTGIGLLNPFRYRSYFYNEDSGYYFLGSRIYDPLIGRFLSPDSVEYADPTKVDGLNLYAYCYNNPVMYSDPTGHDPEWWEWLVGVALVAATTLLMVVTAGTAAVVIGASAAVTTAMCVGAGIATASAGVFNLVGQAAQGVEEINLGSLMKDMLISGTVGMVTGGISGMAAGMSSSASSVAQVIAHKGMQVGANMALSVSAYTVQSAIQGEMPTLYGLGVSAAGGLFSGLAFRTTGTKSFALNLGLELASYGENIFNILRRIIKI